jgi:hypothetical protein
MYWPQSSRRSPSNRQCRIATLEFAVGWATVFISPILVQYGRYLGGLSVMALGGLLALHGAATLQRANPTRGLLLLNYALRMGYAKQAPPLDERDLWLRYRAFTISYMVLVGMLFALILVISSVGAWQLSHHTKYMPLTWLYVIPLWLGPLLPTVVLPWLERDQDQGEEAVAQARYPASEQATGALRLYPLWIRIVASSHRRIALDCLGTRSLGNGVDVASAAHSPLAMR